MVLIIRMIVIITILYSLLYLIFGNIGPGSDNFRNGVCFLLIISMVGIFKLKNLYRYGAIILLFIFFFHGFDYGETVLRTDKVGLALQFFPLFVIIFFFIPRVSKKFKS